VLMHANVELRTTRAPDRPHARDSTAGMCLPILAILTNIFMAIQESIWRMRGCYTWLAPASVLVMVTSITESGCDPRVRNKAGKRVGTRKEGGKHD
jgi:hypothetical protein